MSIVARPGYLLQIDEALQHRATLLSMLEAASSESSWIAGSKRVRHVIDSLRSDVNAETVIEDAVLAAWLPAIMATSESNNQLNRFDSLIGLLQLESSRRRTHWFALAYPIFLLLVSIIIFIFVASFVVPVFEKIFVDFELRLPLPTSVLFAISSFVTLNPVAFVAYVIAGFVLLFIAIRLSAIVIEWSQLSRLLGTLSAGNAANLVAMARFAGTLAEMLRIGASLPEALMVAGTASQRLHFRVRSEQLAVEIQSSPTWRFNSLVSHNFPPTILHALTAGANGDPSIVLLRQLAVLYGDRSEYRIGVSSDLITPVAILIVGALIGSIIIALFLPLVSLVTSLS
jgi:type IV pilus assembly protein PilC